MLLSRRETFLPELTFEYVRNAVELTQFSNLMGTVVQIFVFYIFKVLCKILQPLYSEFYIKYVHVQCRAPSHLIFLATVIILLDDLCPC